MFSAAGLPACDVQRLQSILNAAVRLVAGSSRRDHVTFLLRDRHWLPVQQRVEYKLCTIFHRCLYGDAPSYLVDLITPSGAASTRAGLRSAESMTVAVPLHAVVNWRPLFCDGRLACMEQATVTPPSDTVCTEPRVTAHPSGTSVPVIVLLYSGPLLCCFNVPIKGLNNYLTVTY